MLIFICSTWNISGDLIVNEKFMDIAYKEALKSFENDEIPVGCVIVKNNVIISKAHNCKESKNNSIMHAELLAVDRACKKIGNWRLDDCILYTTLEPCMMCMGAIVESRIKFIYYGCKSKNEQMYDVDKLKKNGFVIFNMDVDKCSSILSDFFKNKRKK